MPQRPDNDATEVHVLEAGAARRGRGPTFLLAGLLLVAAGGGAWIRLTDPFGDSGTSKPLPLAAGNLLGEGWSFETSPSSGPAEHWQVDEDAPMGFSFVADAAVSGQAGAWADPRTERDAPDGGPLTGTAGWARMFSRSAFRLRAGARLVQFSGTSDSDDLQLLVRFEAVDRPPMNVVVASGAGRLVGHARPPPGYTDVRAGVSCVGPAAVDDLDLRFVEPAAAEPAHGQRGEPLTLDVEAALGTPHQLGHFDVLLGDPRGVTVLRGEELVLRFGTPTVVLADGRGFPADVALLPGSDSLAAPGGVRVGFHPSIETIGRQLVVAEQLTGVPPESVVVHHALVTGVLGRAPLGIRSSRGFERFSDDIRVEGVDALLMGNTQNRLSLEMGTAFDLTATHRNDGTLALTISMAGSGSVDQRLAFQAEFHSERVEAAQIRDSALAHEAAGRLGAALQDIAIIAEQYPFDERVLAEALQTRARIQASMQHSLDALDADLEDALFLGNAERCREVRRAALQLAEAFAGSEAEQQFGSRALSVDERAARLLDDDLLRRRERVDALVESFRAHGGYERIVRELEHYLGDHLQPLGRSGAEPGGVPAVPGPAAGGSTR